MTQLLATHNIPLPLAQSIAAITRSQPVSCQEAVLQMLGIDLIRLSDQVLFLNTPVPRLRKANTLRLHRQGASFKLTNITEYECRPNTPELKNITFVEYFENYEIRKEMRKTGDHEFLGRDTTSGCNFIYKRKEPIVVRLTRCFPDHSDPDGFFFNLLLMHCPFVTENDFTNGPNNDKNHDSYYAECWYVPLEHAYMKCFFHSRLTPNCITKLLSLQSAWIDRHSRKADSAYPRLSVQHYERR